MNQINQKIIRFFSTLADETRLKILVAISKGPATVNEIHQELGTGNITLSGVSHQLRMMHDLGIISLRREGRSKYYQLSSAYCWCPLRDAFNNFEKKTKCQHCAKIMKEGGKLI